MSYLLDIAYFFALLAAAPVWVVKMIFHGRYRERWNQRLGQAPRSYGLQPTIWIHAVSLGEINGIATLVDEIHRQLPDYRVVISTTTDTGYAAAERRFTPAHTIMQWPMDFTWAVRIALKRVKPSLVVLMEGEAWPNFLAECNRTGIPAMIVNGRMSPDKGYPRYKMLGSIATRLFNRLTAIALQDETYAERFAMLNVEPSKLHVTGMMKFDTVQVAQNVPGQEDLARAMGLTAGPLLVAGGTGPKEEALLIDTWEALREEFPELTLAVVPRKPERFNEVASLIQQRGYVAIRRTSRPDGTAGDLPDNAIILGDTMGELKKFYALATINFVGRSLVPMGGSDMIEAAGLGRPTCFGPHTFNFPQAGELADSGCAQVADAGALVAQLRVWLQSPAAAADDARRAKAYVQSKQGATKRNVELIAQLLGRRAPMRSGDIATDLLETPEE